MLSERERARAIRLAAVDILIMVVAFELAYLVRVWLLAPLMGHPLIPSISTFLWLVAWAIPVYGLLLFWRGAYEIDLRREPLATLTLVLRPFVIGTLLLGTVIFVVQAKEFSRPIFFIFAGLSCAGVCTSRLLANQHLRSAVAHGRVTRNAVIVGATPRAVAISRALATDGRLGVKVMGHLRIGSEPAQAHVNLLGDIEDLERVLDHHVVDEVVIALQPHELVRVRDLIGPCEVRGITVHVLANFTSGHLANASMNLVNGVPLMTFRSTPHHAADIVLKRAIDILVSAVALLLLSPLMASTAIATWLESGRPILFTQKRKGLVGREFVLYKFRSMWKTHPAFQEDLQHLNEMSGPVFKARNDPRVTRVGRYIRRYSIDELPQLWNVLKGDMSLVGPRPPVPEEVVQYEAWQRRRLSIKPGITCLWQVSGRNDVDFDRWMDLDLHYINHWSLVLDLKILLKTIPAVLLAKGAR